jgi:hypothetical protein
VEIINNLRIKYSWWCRNVSYACVVDNVAPWWFIARHLRAGGRWQEGMSSSKPGDIIKKPRMKYSWWWRNESY